MRNISLKLVLVSLFAMFSLGCANCVQTEPNIRTEQGIELCGDMCSTLTLLKCKGYYENVTMPVWDGAIGEAVTLTCKQFCEYQMSNSTPINTACMKDISSCDEITTKCGE